MVRDRKLEITSIWIVSNTVRIDEIEIEQPIGGKSPREYVFLITK